jgi:hypothetical protein
MGSKPGKFQKPIYTTYLNINSDLHVHHTEIFRQNYAF